MYHLPLIFCDLQEIINGKVVIFYPELFSLHSIFKRKPFYALYLNTMQRKKNISQYYYFNQLFSKTKFLLLSAVHFSLTKEYEQIVHGISTFHAIPFYAITFSLQDLKCLTERYLEPLQGEQCLTSAEIQQLFGNIQEIVAFQQRFLHSLEEAVESVPEFFTTTNLSDFKVCGGILLI